MAITITHTQPTFTNGDAEAILRAAAPTANGLILQNLGTGFFYYTLNGSPASQANGLRLAPGETKEYLGSGFSDGLTGEWFGKGEIRGIYLGGLSPGGADPDVAVLNMVTFTTP